MLAFFGYPQEGPTILFCDNEAACLLAESNTSSKRLKHVATRIAFLRELVEGGIISIQHIRTDGMIADICTKPLPGDRFHRFRQLLVE